MVNKLSEPMQCGSPGPLFQIGLIASRIAVPDWKMQQSVVA